MITTRGKTKQYARMLQPVDVLFMTAERVEIYVGFYLFSVAGDSGLKTFRRLFRQKYGNDVKVSGNGEIMMLGIER